MFGYSEAEFIAIGRAGVMDNSEGLRQAGAGERYAVARVT